MSEFDGVDEGGGAVAGDSNTDAGSAEPAEGAENAAATATTSEASSLEEGAGAAPAAVCLSCGTPVVGPFCPNCGQKNDDLRRSSFVLASEFMRDTFGFDSRMWRTLGLLAITPGAVPSTYANGKRSRYTPPVRLFLVVSFLFFLTLSLTKTLFIAIELNFDRTENESVITLLEPSDGQTSAERAQEILDEEFDRVKESMTEEQVAAVEDIEDHSLVLNADEENCPSSGSLRFFVREETLTPVDRDIRDCLTIEANETSSESDLVLRDAANRVIGGVAFALEKPSAFNDSFNAWLPRIMFMMTPILALILALFIRGKDALIFDHLVFSLYSHAAAFAIVGIAVFLTQLGVPETGLLAVLGLTAYYVAALKRAYGRGWTKTLWTTFMSGFFYFLILFSAVLYIVSRIIWRAAA